MKLSAGDTLLPVMSLSDLPDDLTELPQREKLLLISMLWQSLEAQADGFPLSAAEKDLIDQRLRLDAKQPDDGMTKAEFFQRLDSLAA